MRKGENIRKRKDGRFEARFISIETGKYVSVYAKTYSEVKNKVNLYKKSQIPCKDVKIQTIESIAYRWLDSVKATVKKSTYARYYDIVNMHIITRLGNICLNKISQKTIDDFIYYCITEGRLDKKGGLSAKTSKDILNVLMQILKSHNISMTYKMPNIKPEEVEIFSNNDYKIFLHYLLLDTDIEKMGLLLALLCGLRLGELCALQWKDIDLNNETISITKTIQRVKNINQSEKKTTILIDTPKSLKSIRKIPIQKILMKKLILLKKEDPECYLLSGTKKYIEPRTMQNHFKRHLELCRLPDTNFHTLRHTFASKCIESSMDMKTLSELLGHSDVKFTMSKYVHSSMDIKRVELEKLMVTF